MPNPRKPIGQIMREGTYNATRHARRLSEPQFDGDPVRPKGMPKEAQWLWDAVVPMLVAKGVVKAVDAPALEVMCRVFAELQSALRTKPSYDIDHRRKRQMLINGYSREWHAWASKFGLTPGDRARLEVDPGKERDNPLQDFLDYQPVLNIHDN